MDQITATVALLRDGLREAEYNAYERRVVTLERSADGSYTHAGPIMFPEVDGVEPVEVQGFYIENRAQGLSRYVNTPRKSFKPGVSPALFDFEIKDLDT